MAYEKQTWETGDTITAAKLNHMEDGIGAGGSGYDIVFHEVTPEEGNPTVTGEGISPSEALTKIANGEHVALLFTGEVAGQCVTMIPTFVVNESNTLSFFGLVGNTIGMIYLDTTSAILFDYSMYDISYSDGVYTFTFTGRQD